MGAQVRAASAQEYATDVAVDQRGNTYVAGWTDGTLAGQTSRGNDDTFVRKYRH